MIKALMPVNTDLESSIALRYVNMLSKWISLMLHDIHVVESERVGPAPGTGWVRRTWENALIENATQEILSFIAMENVNVKRLGDSEIRIGNRTDLILESLLRLKYQLFIEGALPTFNLSNFHTRVHSRLYRSMPCPALIVKNLVDPGKMAILIKDGAYANLISTFLNIFASSGVSVDLINYSLTQSGELIVKETNSSEKWLNDAENMIADQGLKLQNRITLEGPASEIAEYSKEYGLVAASLSRNPRKHDPELEVLAHVPTPVLICWSKS